MSANICHYINHFRTFEMHFELCWYICIQIICWWYNVLQKEPKKKIEKADTYSSTYISLSRKVNDVLLMPFIIIEEKYFSYRSCRGSFARSSTNKSLTNQWVCTLNSWNHSLDFKSKPTILFISVKMIYSESAVLGRSHNLAKIWLRQLCCEAKDIKRQY